MDLQEHRDALVAAEAAAKSEDLGRARGSEEPVAGDSATELTDEQQAQCLAEMRGARVEPNPQQKSKPHKRR